MNYFPPARTQTWETYGEALHNARKEWDELRLKMYMDSDECDAQIVRSLAHEMYEHQVYFPQALRNMLLTPEYA